MLIPAVVSVASVSVFTRVLDAEAYGLYSVVTSAVTILIVVASGWIEQAVLRYLPEYDAARSRRDTAGLVVGLTAATCVAVALLALVVFVSARAHLGAYTRLFIPATLLLIAETSFIALGAVLQSRLRSHAVSILRSSGAVLRFALALGFLWWIGRDVRWLLLGAAVGRGLSALATLVVVARDVDGWARPRFDGAAVRRFAAYGAPMLGWTLASRVYGVSDRFIIEAFQGSAAVGVYSANYTLVTMGFGLLSAPLLTAAHPLIVKAWKDHGPERAPDVVASFARLYVLVLTPVVAVLALCSREVSAILLGSPFREGHEIIPIVVLGVFVWGFSMYGHKGLELAEHTGIMCAFAVLTAAINVGLNLIFVPAYGYRAAAVTTLACSFIYPTLVHWISKRYVPWRIPWPTIAEALAASAVALALGALVRRALSSTPPLVVVLATGVVMTTAYTGLVVWRERARGRREMA